jgi:hypothetical protein
METSFEEIRQLLRELVISQQETDAKFKETDAKFKESATEFKELRETIKELAEDSKTTERKIKEQGKQIGGIGERFGYFTEGLAINSMERILRRQFQADHITPRAKVYDKQGNIKAEYDVLAYCNSDTNTVVVVEVKSTLRPQYVTEFEKVLQEFKALNSEHSDKKLYGILTFIGNFDKDLEKHCHTKGIYTATIHNEIFKLNNGLSAFTPKNFNTP